MVFELLTIGRVSVDLYPQEIGRSLSEVNSTYAGWQCGLRIPQVRGPVVGRALLYPEDGDVKRAVDRADQLREGGRHD